MEKSDQEAEQVVYLGDTLAFHFRLIPKGTFLMGSPEQEKDYPIRKGHNGLCLDRRWHLCHG